MKLSVDDLNIGTSIDLAAEHCVVLYAVADTSVMQIITFTIG